MGKKVDYEKIKECRVEKGLTQADLSEKSGINISIIKSLETGRSITNDENIKIITDALNIDFGEIVNEDYRETKVIAVTNNKGGSGKTSVVASLGYCLAEMDKKVLLIDSDMQMNLSFSYGFGQDPKNLNNAILEENDLQNYIKQTEYENIDIILADFELASLDMIIFTKKLRETVFKRILQNTIDSGKYDYILIDTNPTLSLLNYNILNGSDYVIVPVEMTAFGILGLEVLTRFIKESQEMNSELKLAGVLRTKVDKREGITEEANKVLESIFEVEIFDSSIPIDTNVKKAQWEQQPLNIFSKNSRANKAYRRFAKELISVIK